MLSYKTERGQDLTTQILAALDPSVTNVKMVSRPKNELNTHRTKHLGASHLNEMIKSMTKQLPKPYNPNMSGSGPVTFTSEYKCDNDFTTKG